MMPLHCTDMVLFAYDHDHRDWHYTSGIQPTWTGYCKTWTWYRDRHLCTCSCIHERVSTSWCMYIMMDMNIYKCMSRSQWHLHTRSFINIFVSNRMYMVHTLWLAHSWINIVACTLYIHVHELIYFYVHSTHKFMNVISWYVCTYQTCLNYRFTTSHQARSALRRRLV